MISIVEALTGNEEYKGKGRMRQYGMKSSSVIYIQHGFLK
ncbi:hypothetical protein TERMP_02107 [Thermococcus barophilus MP]|uniref:Uncharacterized protein n=1 Tax=Thermococcus barophilus (strain DSM 11836 / MP) TaxID=391623 RepID=F0LLY2_THEBM|nr:hypothetical protein TERMP_02107 [Thermococcus barophilus MP]